MLDDNNGVVPQVNIEIQVKMPDSFAMLPKNVL
jgi:hypothetical protein